MKDKIFIVESPTKEHTIQQYLGDEYEVISSMGHIIDLPKKKLGVDISNKFKPTFEIMKGKENIVSKIKKIVKNKKLVLLGTDPDREGEAIAWHIKNFLIENKIEVKRIVFNEITRDVILNALTNLRDIDENLVHSQFARRILDRIVGYKISPLLWKNVRKNLSAGRVQSVALKMICMREEEIDNFVNKEYWEFNCQFKHDSQHFDTKLKKIDGKKTNVKSEEKAVEVEKDLKSRKFHIASVNKKVKLQKPPLPFKTSTLQQETSKRYGYSPSNTMRIAQQLYEGITLKNRENVGLITYMRTDSTRISETAAKQARVLINSKFGEEYLATYRVKEGKKGAKIQDAHEAIRPSDVKITPISIKSFLTTWQYKLYDLIWKRYIASFMPPAKYDILEVTVNDSETKYELGATGKKLVFNGYIKVYGSAEKDISLPSDISINLPVILTDVKKEQKFTQPKPRFTIATLIKNLESEGIGRPSTYASIISTLLKRTYVSIIEKKLVPNLLGRKVYTLLNKHFPTIMDIKFTAKMEDDLDSIERGENDHIEILNNFYKDFAIEYEEAKKQMQNIKSELIEKTDRKCPKCGSILVIRHGRYGKFVSCSDYPKCKYSENINKDKETDMVCEKCGSKMVLKEGRFGKFYACSNYPKCKNVKPFLIDIKCPECGHKLIQARSKKRRTFYKCSNKECKFITFYTPVNSPCPACSYSLTVKKKIKGEMHLFCLKCKHSQKLEENKNDDDSQAGDNAPENQDNQPPIDTNEHQ